MPPLFQSPRSLDSLIENSDVSGAAKATGQVDAAFEGRFVYFELRGAAAWPGVGTSLGVEGHLVKVHLGRDRKLKLGGFGYRSAGMNGGRGEQSAGTYLAARHRRPCGSLHLAEFPTRPGPHGRPRANRPESGRGASSAPLPGTPCAGHRARRRDARRELDSGCGGCSLPASPAPLARATPRLQKHPNQSDGFA